MLDDIIAYHIAPGGTALPVVADECFLCGKRAIVNDHGVVASRINGDSANGYETWHVACGEAEDEAEEARLLAEQDEPEMFRLGGEYVYGGSIAKVVGIGTAPRGLVLLIECSDLFPGVRKLVGPATYNLS